jgi:transposase
MRAKFSTAKKPAEQVVKDIRRATRRHFSAEDKIRIVLEGLRGDDSIAELCREEGIAQSLYYIWSKEFLEVGKRRLAGDTSQLSERVVVRLLFTVGGGRNCDFMERLLPRDYAETRLFKSLKKTGDPGVIRTRGLRFRKPLLYPAELRGRLSRMITGSGGQR